MSTRSGIATLRRAVVASAALTLLVTGAASAAVTQGIHDGSVNSCDNGEHWIHSNGTVTAPSPNGPAAQEAMLNRATNRDGTAWWPGLHVGTVRFSPPWDIALPDSPSDASLVTAHDPTNQWASLHLATLRTEQACFDWWLDAARQAGETVQVAFKPDYDYRDPSTNHILAPSQAVYNTAIADFVSEYSKCAYGRDASGNCALRSGAQGPPGGHGARVHIISPWGEPDFGENTLEGNTLSATEASNRVAIGRSPQQFYIPYGGHTLADPNCPSTRTNYCGPVLAAQYYMSVLNRCGSSCELTAGLSARQLNSGIVAGDFSSAGGSEKGFVPGNTQPQPYYETYQQHLNNCAGCATQRAWTWGIHPYTDTSDYEWCTANGHPTPSSSKTKQFAGFLQRLGYSSGQTAIWLNEVEVYQGGTPWKHPGSCGDGYRFPRGATYSSAFSARRQAFAYSFLTGTLKTGTTLPSEVPSGAPQVTRVYYFRAYPGQDPWDGQLSPGTFSCLYQTIHTGSVAC